MNIKSLIILSIIIGSILYSKEEKVILSINGLESAGLSKRHINYAQYSIREISIDLEEAVSKMIGDKYSISIHFTAYESVENTINVARDSLDQVIKTIKDKYPDENLVTHSISHPYKGIQGVIIGKVQIQVNIDKSINLDNSIDINNVITEYFGWIFMDLQNCPNCISFYNVDMDSLNGKNTISLTRDDIYDNSWAVIIGIDKYQYSKQLNYAVNDAKAVKNMLVDKFEFPEENIKYLVNEEATLSEIKLALDDIATSANEEDRILVFYSGHGETIPTKDDSEKGYIIPYEGKQNKAYATGLAMDEILTTSQLSNAKHMLFLMDACYSGLMTQQYKGLAKPIEEGYLTKVANESSRQIITAGGRDQQVIERDEWQHSAFTKNLLEGLESWDADYNDDGCITANELSLYLRENVTEDSDGLQTPQDGRFINSGGGEFVFFGSGDGKINQDKKLINDKESILSKFGIIAGSMANNRKGDRYYCRNISGLYNYITDKVGLEIGYESCLGNRNIIDHEVISIAFTIHELKGSKRDVFYYLVGIDIENNYSLANQNSIGLIPRIGYGYNFSVAHISLKIGYIIYDYNNISSEFNGYTLSLGIGFNVFEMINYISNENHY